MSFERLRALYKKPESEEEAQIQIDTLRRMVFSLCQEVAVIKGILEDNSLCDPASYRERRVRRMVSDHSGAGPAPWMQHSHYRFCLPDEEFLRQVFGATEEELEDYRREVEFVSTLS